MSDLTGLIDDLAAEQAALDEVVAALAVETWAQPTPSPGWTIADQIGHLAYFDRAAALALSDPEAFARSIDELITEATARGLDEATLADARALEPAALLASWREARSALARAARQADPTVRVPWYGPPMAPTTFVRARLMETWAHGVDVTDALGRAPLASARLRHVALLGLKTRAWSYAVRAEEPPSTTVALALVGPAGEQWRLGPEGADEVVSGPALDLCLVVVQRRHLDDTALVCGPAARHWLERAQAFAGGPTVGPRPGSRGAPR